MDSYSRSWYEMAYAVTYLTARGDTFQDFFSDIMEKRYPEGDFARVRPWGKVGDKKNDGYLKSTRQLFQCYAPNELTASAAKKKIKEDFAGALPHWQKHFDFWVFVHNSKAGLGPDVLALLLDLDQKKPPSVLSWGFEDIKKVAFELPVHHLRSIFGEAPSAVSFNGVTFKELETVINVIARKPFSDPSAVQPVPPGKLAYNSLSSSVDNILKGGMGKANQVRFFFANHHDRTLGDEIAQAFNDKYKELKKSISDPDQIFFELYCFAGGHRRQSPDIESAILAVLAFLFEECEIFERPPS